MTKHLDVTDYLADPKQAVALLNRVLGSRGSDQAIRQAVIVLTRSLQHAGFGRVR